MTHTSDPTWPLWRYDAPTPAYWDDYVSHIRVFEDRVEITTGWKTPATFTIPADTITDVVRGLFSTTGFVSIYTADEQVYELMAAWDKPTRMEFVKAIKSIMPNADPFHADPPAEQDDDEDDNA